MKVRIQQTVSEVSAALTPTQLAEIDSLVDAHEWGLAVEFLVDFLLESDAEITLGAKRSLENLHRALGSTRGGWELLQVAGTSRFSSLAPEQAAEHVRRIRESSAPLPALAQAINAFLDEVLVRRGFDDRDFRVVYATALAVARAEPDHPAFGPALLELGRLHWSASVALEAIPELHDSVAAAAERLVPNDGPSPPGWIVNLVNHHHRRIATLRLRDGSWRAFVDYLRGIDWSVVPCGHLVCRSIVDDAIREHHASIDAEARALLHGAFPGSTLRLGS